MSSPRAARLLRFGGRVLRKTHLDALGLRASALAYTTLVSLVPLLATVSFFVARTLREDDRRTFELLAQLLPYSESSVITALEGFVAQAESVRGVGLLGFLFVGLSAFFTVDSTLHRIFGVELEPSIGRRAFRFAVLVFWGPLLIGASYSVLLLLSQTSVAGAWVRDSWLLRGIPTAATFVGLTMLFWRASAGRVRLRDAALGSLLSTLALEALKWGFELYVASFTAVTRVVYGSFAIALFFVLSIQLAWWLMLVGAEVAICLSRPDEPRDVERPARRAEVWRALAALAALAQARDEAAATAGPVADAAGIEPADLRRLMAPLVERGLVSPPFTAQGRWRLAVPARELPLRRVFEAYPIHQSSPEGALADLRRRAERAATAEIGALTLLDLVLPPETVAREAATTAPTDAPEPPAPPPPDEAP